MARWTAAVFDSADAAMEVGWCERQRTGPCWQLCGGSEGRWRSDVCIYIHTNTEVPAVLWHQLPHEVIFGDVWHL